MEYDFRTIEQKWREKWVADQAYAVKNDPSKPKYYVLDMFPYPSGAGLHVGHPLGYIASDIFARFKRLQGFNVLHPMGYDAFGLPAEQYAIERGVHPAVSTEENIRNFRRQLDNIGFSFDWSRQVKTSDPSFYKWTQWIFLQLFNSWYDPDLQKAAPVTGLIARFVREGNAKAAPHRALPLFSSADWSGYTEKQQADILMEYRLAYCGVGEVNWCEALGTVLANDEVVNGVSERGGHPVVKKKLRQWYLRITEYADRLLEGLERVEFSDSMKEMQSNWIGRSFGAEVEFALEGSSKTLTVYTTRPDTMFGVDFMVLAPEHGLIGSITTPAESAAVNEYVAYVNKRSERERAAEKKITGCFTGAYALNPFSGARIPVWISEYVLAGYGTGAIMAVPCGDDRDFRFARHFGIPVTNIIGDFFNGSEANPTKDAILSNSGFLNGTVMRDAIGIVNGRLEEMSIGRRRVNYRMRDAAFSRQRYWGEPFPIRWTGGIAEPLPESALPLMLPEVERYQAGPEGEGPLANLPAWTDRQLETNTMPGYAGSSWYFLRYMDPQNDQEFCGRAASDYWNQVDLYIGGTEHAVGHLLYSRMWTKFLFDIGKIGFDEPYLKLVNQGMIQGSSRFVYRVHQTNRFVSQGLKDKYPTDRLHVNVELVDGLELNMDGFRKWKPEFADAEFETENGKYICGAEVEKMSKSKFNTVDPSGLVNRYGADTFRMYEMFLGPVEQSKPWDTKGIEGVHRFLRKLWRLFFDETKGAIWTPGEPTPAEKKVLHRTIKKIGDDTERFSFNTGVSALMIAVNDLSDLKCQKREILSPLLVILSPYAPHFAEELWQQTGHSGSILDATFPVFDPAFLVESVKNYPVAINGKTRAELSVSLDATQEQVESMIMADPSVTKWLEGRSPKKIIYVRNKMINVVF